MVGSRAGVEPHATSKRPAKGPAERTIETSPVPQPRAAAQVLAKAYLARMVKAARSRSLVPAQRVSEGRTGSTSCSPSRDGRTEACGAIGRSSKQARHGPRQTGIHHRGLRAGCTPARRTPRREIPRSPELIAEDQSRISGRSPRSHRSPRWRRGATARRERPRPGFPSGRAASAKPSDASGADRRRPRDRRRCRARRR